MNVGVHKHSKSDRAQFLGKILICPKKGGNRVFGLLREIKSLVVARNDTKHPRPHINNYIGTEKHMDVYIVLNYEGKFFFVDLSL